VPEHINPGQVGYINASIEHPYNDSRSRVRIHDVYTHPDYRDAGVAGRMINQTEQYAQRHNAREIYGVIAEPQAKLFWEQQADRGWQLVQNGSFLEVHKQL
jgi:GNAT superfamily N-acetyltransferase